MQRDNDFGSAIIEIFGQSVGVEGFIGDEAVEFDAVSQRSDTDDVVALAGQENEIHQIAERVGQRQDFGGPLPVLQLASRLVLGPPIAPRLWR